jgi:hypothetical protein
VGKLAAQIWEPDSRWQWAAKPCWIPFPRDPGRLLFIRLAPILTIFVGFQ